MTEIDLKFLSGKFFETEIPKDQLYLLKYFHTKIQEEFLKYFLFFGSYRGFVNHTGIYCAEVWLKKMKKKLKKILSAHERAKKTMDFDLLWKITNGEYACGY